MKFEYTVRYSDRKTVRITVERDRAIVVRAPRRVSPDEIKALLDRKSLWIYEKLNHPQKYDPAACIHKRFVAGESILYLGSRYRLEIAKDADAPLRFDGRFHLALNAREDAPKLFKAWFKERAREIITPQVEEIARNLGVTYNRIMISDLKYRWGSCTPLNNLNFNWRIIRAPMPVVKYIVAHELAHLIELNHSPRFWNIVAVQAPHYRRAKEWLKENGGELEMDF